MASSDQATGFLGGFIRASATRLATTVLNKVVTAASTEINPYTVQEITGKSIEEVSNCDKVTRDKHSVLLLYEKLKSTIPSCSVVLHQPSPGQRMWYLYRSRDVTEATNAFNKYKPLSILVKADSFVCDTTVLQKICSKLREPACDGWTPAHIAAEFDYFKAFQHSLMKEFLNLQEGPSLKTPLHVALESKSIGSVKELINLGIHLDVKDIKNNNVLHFAAASSAQALKLILDKLPERLSPLQNEWNDQGMTPLSIASKQNLSQNVEMLLTAGCDVSVRTKNEGYPVTIALKNNCPLSMEVLLKHSSEQINFIDTVDGSCALHWASGPEVLQVLLDRGGDPNIPNKEGQTPLHTQARRGCLKGCLSLLCQGAFPDLKDSEGNTALHVAAKLCSQIIIQVLICFEADLDLVNDQGQSARHLVSTSQRSNQDQVLFILDSCGARRCPAFFQDSCTDGCKWNGVNKGIPPEKYIGALDPTMVQEALEAFSTTRHILNRSRRGSFSGENAEHSPTGQSTATGSRVRSSLLDGHIGGRLLSLDGGGIRGLVLTQILICMQKEFGVPIVELFDWIAGTSTGGIMAVCLASGKSPIEIQCLYLRLKDKVFVGDRPYSVEIMEEFLKNELGHETKMSDLRRPRLMITTAIANHRPPDFHFFRNYLSPSVIMGEPARDACNRSPEDLFVWEVAKATGAAPSYFKLDAKYIDGGLVANNPTLDALTELTQFGAVLRANGETNELEANLPSVVVSLGTGVLPRVPSNFANYDISRPETFLDAISKVSKIVNVVALLVEQATQAEGQIVERARAWCASIGVPYYRFSPHLSSIVDLDETNEEVLVTIMWETRAYLHANRHSLIHLKRLLFANGSPPSAG